MSLSVHILRQTADGQELPITLDEWNAYIDSDSELKRPEPGHLNYSQTLVLLPSDTASPDDWQGLSWTTGSISSDYPQQPMLKKIGQIARHFGAVIMSDDGDIWTIDEEGRVQVAAPATDFTQPATETKTEVSHGRMWPYFDYDEKTDSRRIIIWLMACQPERKADLAERCLADGLRIPIHEAAAALRACGTQPIGVPAPEDFLEAVTLCERLGECGIEVKGCGVLSPPWKK
jgi:hypothetical protein